jgi:hypothetical protein
VLVVTHALPAVVVWGVVGLGLGALRAADVGLVLTFVYAVVFGVNEALELRWAAPTSQWQVPRGWAGPERSFRRRAVIWGATLGPGLMTRNPYAGMWCIASLLVACGSLRVGLAAGVAVGLCHGIARAGGVVDNALRRPTDIHLAMARYFEWRVRDGISLLFLAGALVAVISAR